MKAQLELDLSIAVKDNKKWFYISNIKRAKENIHLSLVAEGSIVTKDEEKAEVHDAFFASVFNRRPVIPRATNPLSW